MKMKWIVVFSSLFILVSLAACAGTGSTQGLDGASGKFASGTQGQTQGAGSFQASDQPAAGDQAQAGSPYPGPGAYPAPGAGANSGGANSAGAPANASAGGAPAGGALATPQPGAAGEPRQDGELPPPLRLALGAVYLEATSTPLSAEQAGQLVTLWQEFSALSVQPPVNGQPPSGTLPSDGGQPPATPAGGSQPPAGNPPSGGQPGTMQDPPEVRALIEKIAAVLTPEQLQAIQAMPLNMQDVQALLVGMGLEEMSLPQDGSQSGAQGLPGMDPELLQAIIEFLQAKGQ